MKSDKLPRRPSSFEGLFCHEGDFWTIAFEGRLVRLKDAKGLRYLAHLLRHPGEPFHVSELGGVAGLRSRDAAPGPVAERTRKAVTNRIRQTVTRITGAHEILGAHLTNAVRTGTTCSYTPERAVRWAFEAPRSFSLPRE